MRFGGSPEVISPKTPSREGNPRPSFPESLLSKPGHLAILRASLSRFRVTTRETPTDRRLFGRERYLAALLGAGLLCPLLVSFFLQPDARGHGTHQQLGLPPCTFEVLFGLPCPSCGSTTAFAYAVRGRLTEALRANVGGTILAGLFAVAGPWLLWSAARGRWFVVRLSGPCVAVIAAVIATIMVIDWVIRLCGR